MSDRTVVEYEEPRQKAGPSWRLKIDYSSSGKPTVFVGIISEWENGTHYDEKSIVVEDAPRVFAPLIQWLKEKEIEDGRE